LQWQYLNYPLCVTELLRYLPERYTILPVFVTEFNHIWKTSEAVGDYGWVNDQRASEITQMAYAHAQLHNFAGLALYRWAGDEWELQHNHYVLDAIKNI
jgi:hypothetical protein